MRAITRKHMLYKSKVEYMSGEGVYAMNHVLGCSHGCKYPCYAYLNAKRFGQVEGYEDWCEPKLVENTLELLDRELLADREEPVRRVHMCFTTDPFMCGQEAVQRLTLDAASFINRKCGIPITFLTKGTYPRVHRRPLVYADGSAEDALWFEHKSCLIGTLHPGNEYGISLSSFDEGFRARWEPGSAPYAERVECLKALHDAGCRTWVSMEPWPSPSMPGQRMIGLVDACEELLEALERVAFADRIVFGRWNYNAAVSEHANTASEYRALADMVEEFCGEAGIECVIKSGTTAARAGKEARNG